MTAAVIPVKSLAASKSRLLPELPRKQLNALCLAMLEDLIGALQQTPGIDRVAVATPDDRVAEHALRLGAHALHGPDPGLNAAIDAAPGKLGLAPDAPLLVVLGVTIFVGAMFGSLSLSGLVHLEVVNGGG